MLVVAGALHVAEEYLLDWRSWAQEVSGLPLTWDRFWFVNAGFLLLASAAAFVGWKRPEISLALPSLAMINGVFFHLGPTLVLGRLSPGVATSVLLYLPISTWVFWQAYEDGRPTVRVAAVSVALGASVMALPFLLVRAG